MSSELHIPEPLLTQFLSQCAEANIDGDQAIKELMEEFMADLEDARVAKERLENDEDGRTLDQIIEEHGLDV